MVLLMVLLSCLGVVLKGWRATQGGKGKGVRDKSTMPIIMMITLHTYCTYISTVYR